MINKKNIHKLFKKKFDYFKFLKILKDNKYLFFLKDFFLYYKANITKPNNPNFKYVDLHSIVPLISDFLAFPIASYKS